MQNGSRSPGSTALLQARTWREESASLSDRCVAKRLAFQTVHHMPHAAHETGIAEPPPARDLPPALPRAAIRIQTIRSLLPYLWPTGNPVAHARGSSWRCVFLVLAKVRHGLCADHLWPHRRCAGAERTRRRVLAVPVALIVAYGAAARRLRRVRRIARRAVRRGAAARRRGSWRCGPSGICTRCRCASIWTARPAACRASSIAARSASQSVLRLAVFNVVPTLFELVMVTAIIWRLFDWRFAAVTLRRGAAPISASPPPSPTAACAIRRTMNDTDNDARPRRWTAC